MRVIAGGAGARHALHKLLCAHDVALTCCGTLLIADPKNHRVMSCEQSATRGTLVAGDNGKGGALNQLDYQTGVEAVADHRRNLALLDILVLLCNEHLKEKS